MKANHFITILLLSGLFFSCEKKDKSITLPPKGDGTAIQVNMGENYTEHFYVSLENQKIVKTGSANEWDLAFSCEEDNSIYMNGGQGMAAYPTGKISFESVSDSDTTAIENKWAYDGSTGDKDSCVLGNWIHLNQVFIVKLNRTDKHYKKIKISEADAFQYVIEVGDLNAATPVTRTLVKNADFNFIYFSLHQLAQVANVEPIKSSYDLHFTTYNYSFYDQTPVLRYIVVGCLLNNNNTYAYKDSIIGYNSFTKETSSAIQYTNHWDAIGYDWKKIDWASGTTDYTIDKRYTFVIRTQNNRFYKLRFLDFYSPTGEKGSPKFEFVEL
jgi:HmuY protein